MTVKYLLHITSNSPKRITPPIQDSAIDEKSRKRKEEIGKRLILNKLSSFPPYPN